jgi:anti-sigma regulatory factor (Ser/Thr protein kinase)
VASGNNGAAKEDRVRDVGTTPRAEKRLSRARAFEARPASLARVRMFVRDMAERSQVPPALVTDLLLAVSEACTNAVVHSGSPQVQVEWVQRSERVHVAVRDDGVFLPEDEVRHHGLSAGLGFHLMQATVDRVLVEPGTPQRPGTVVWLEKSLHGERGLESA